MPEPIRPEEIHQRWNEIRTNPKCNLSLEPAAVAKFLRVPESSIVRERVFETLVQFADYRISEPAYVTEKTSGDLATCEGLETFLVPAVEEVYTFSDFLKNYARKDPSASDRFAQTFKDDLNGLLNKWTKAKPEFSGEPYTRVKSIQDAIEVSKHKTYAPFNISESAALACRVIVHVLALKYKGAEEDEFVKKIAAFVDDERLLKGLSQAVDFLVDGFRKSDKGDTEERIVNATWDDSPGSGWSWTASPPNTPSLPPMLFFTAAAVDAFAEVDLYLIRPALENKFRDRAPLIQQFYEQKKSQLHCLDLCVDMARRWVQGNVLDSLTYGTGQYLEKYPPEKGMGETLMALGDVEIPESSLAALKEARISDPTTFYNNLYALQILLWAFSDRSEDAKNPDEEAKGIINKALNLLVYNYTSVPGLQAILIKTRHKFILPGRGVFKKPDMEAKVEYEDAAFLPLMMRLLVQFVVYGVGDRNLLEPVIRNLYVELLQRRNRTSKGYGSLWSTDTVEVFSTQRAIQALTFYHAYAAGKEIAEGDRGDGIGGDAVILKYKTGKPLVLQLVAEDASQAPPPPPPPAPRRDPAAEFRTKFGESFPGYARQLPGFKAPPPPVSNEDEALIGEIEELAAVIYRQGNEGGYSDLHKVEQHLSELAGLLSQPWDGKLLRRQEFETVKQNYAGEQGAARATSAR